jgi:hypothetical protein
MNLKSTIIAKCQFLKKDLDFNFYGFTYLLMDYLQYLTQTKLKTTRAIRMKTKEKTPNPNKLVQLIKHFPPFF